MSNANMLSTAVSTRVANSPAEAPVYGDDTKMLRMTAVVVVSNGTQAGRPTVDIQMEDANGNKYLIMTTGALMTAINQVIVGSQIYNAGSGGNAH